MATQVTIFLSGTDVTWMTFRNVTGYLKLGRQVVTRHAAAAWGSLLFCQKTGWALAHPVHPPVTPLTLNSSILNSKKITNRLPTNYTEKQVSGFWFNLFLPDVSIRLTKQWAFCTRIGVFWCTYIFKWFFKSFCWIEYSIWCMLLTFIWQGNYYSIKF